MMQNKYDNSMLPIILACMCYSDRPLSLQLSRLFLTCINDLTHVDNTPALFEVIVCLLVEYRHVLEVN